MYKLLTIIFLLGSTVYANTPTFTVGTDPLLNIQNTGTALNLADDALSPTQNLGFDFTYYGNTYTQAKVAMNGFITFNPNFNVYNQRNYMSEVIPASGFDFTVFALWSDFIDKNNNNGSPYVGTYGDTGSKYWVAGWYNVNEYRNNNLSSFEAILYETTNVIEFRYDKINVSNHDITIGLQGNNEAVTYLRYEDNNSTTFNRTDDWSISTAVDESFTNLSSQCLIDSDFSDLCEVYDLSFDVEEEDDYLQGSGVSDAMLLGYDDEDDFYGFNTEEIYTGALVFSTITDGRSDTGDFHDDFSGVSYIEYDSRDVIEHEDNFNIDDIPFSGDVTLGDYEEGPLSIIEIDVIPLDTLPEIRLTEEEFVEFAQHMDEHFDFEDEIDREEFEEQFEDFEEQVVEESEEREELGETEEEFEEEYEEEFEEEEISEELVEEPGDRPERRTRRRNVVSTTNVNSVVSNSIANSYAGSNSSSTSSTTASAVSGGSGASSVSSSPSISDQIASAQVQTNNVLQSIEILPMPTMDNTPSVVMAEVQVTSMENQIESVTSTMVTSSEAEQIAEEIVANNIRAQQESSQTQQEESGQYDSQGQSNLIAYMNYVPNFSDYTTANITDQTNWYAPTAIYASATLGDNAGYGNMVSDSMDTLYSIMGQQPVGIFIDRR
tara:strand:- start:306 stop:2291 length:1986 start_codon:yes stop_codon:yes gene_type:complete